MSQSIQFKRGNKANLPNLDNGEPALVSDDKDLYIGTPSGNQLIGGQTVLSQLADKANKNTNVFNNQTHGTYDKAVVLSFMANEPDPNAKPQVLGLPTSQSASTYRDRDSVGQYGSNRSTKPTVVVTSGTISYTANTVQVTGASVTGLDKITEGMLIDTYHTPYRYTAIIDSVNVATQTITVKDGWYLAQDGGSTTPSTPSNGIGFDVNRITKIWGRNTNVYLYEGDTTKNAVLEEIGLVKDISDGSIAGIDIINIGKKADFAYKARKADYAPGRTPEGFIDGFVSEDADSAFVNSTASSSVNKALVSSVDGDANDKGFHIGGNGVLSKLKLNAGGFTNGQLIYTSITQRIFILNKTTRENFTLPSPSGRSGEILFVNNVNTAFADLKQEGTGSFVGIHATSVTLPLAPKCQIQLYSDGTNWLVIGNNYQPVRYLAGTPDRGADYIGQQFINTSTGVVYIAIGVGTGSDWKQVSN